MTKYQAQNSFGALFCAFLLFSNKLLWQPSVECHVRRGLTNFRVQHFWQKSGSNIKYSSWRNFSSPFWISEKHFLNNWYGFEGYYCLKKALKTLFLSIFLTLGPPNSEEKVFFSPNFFCTQADVSNFYYNTAVANKCTAPLFLWTHCIFQQISAFLHTKNWYLCLTGTYAN